ncbi:MAG: SH3 domain-containing protein, partial [Caldilineaceae bacterium SB0668_bin_21]|nr:SH3 domain-containing protein [Caldilineaceae bacterium SB0668_bin_21]
MFQLPVLFGTLIPGTALALLLAGCFVAAPQGEPPAPRPVQRPVAESAPESTPADPTAVFPQNANVRTGPDTDYAVAYWLTAGDEVTVVGRNDDGTWLQIEHQGRQGWISAILIGIATEGAAPPAAPAPEPTLRRNPIAPQPAVGPTVRDALTVMTCNPLVI